MDELEIAIIREIATRTPFSFKEIKCGYKTSKSFDVLIKATEVAAILNLPLGGAIMDILKAIKTDES